MNDIGRRAVVVGGGIAGLASAVGLHRAGWQVEVHEASSRIRALGTALGIWPDAQRALRRLGLAHLVDTATRPASQGQLRTSDGRVLLALPSIAPERATRQVAVISRSELLSELAGMLPRGALRLSSRVTDVSRPGGADLVVVADGVFSALRRQVSRDRSEAVYAGSVAFRGIVDGDFGPAGETWGRGMLFGITPLRPGATNWYCSVSGPADAPLDFEGLRRLLAAWPEPIPELVAAVRPEQLLRHPIHELSQPLRTVYRIGVAGADGGASGAAVVIGDAAHAMTPHLGQGACQALLDADELVRQLDRQPDVASALSAYQRARARRGGRFVVASRTLGRISQARRLAGVRNSALYAVGGLVPATRAARRQVGSPAAEPADRGSDS